MHSPYDVAFHSPHVKVLKSQRQDKAMTKYVFKMFNIYPHNNRGKQLLNKKETKKRMVQMSSFHFCNGIHKVKKR
jgi:hypothetical protein